VKPDWTWRRPAAYAEELGFNLEHDTKVPERSRSFSSPVTVELLDRGR
jgi:hypothetical protein